MPKTKRSSSTKTTKTVKTPQTTQSLSSSQSKSVKNGQHVVVYSEHVIRNPFFVLHEVTREEKEGDKPTKLKHHLNVSKEGKTLLESDGVSAVKGIDVTIVNNHTKKYLEDVPFEKMKQILLSMIHNIVKSKKTGKTHKTKKTTKTMKKLKTV